MKKYGNESLLFSDSVKPRKPKSREVSSRFLSSIETGIQSPTQGLSPVRRKPGTSTFPELKKNRAHHHHQLEDPGYLRGLWPSLNDLLERKSSDIFERQRSSRETNRFENDKQSSKENHRPILGGSMRYYTGSSSSSSGFSGKVSSSTKWRYANARAEAVDFNIANHVKRNLSSAWDGLTKLQHSVVQKRIQLQKEKLEMKLNFILQSEFKLLEAWGDMERQHLASVSTTKDCLHSVVCKVPLIEGAKVDVQSASLTFRHASDLTSAIKSMLSTFHPSAGKIGPLISDLAEVVAQESIREAQSLPNPNTHTFFFRCPLRRLLPFLSPSKTLLTQNIAMATLAAAAARQAATLTRISTPRTPFQAANLVQKRDHHGPARVNVWEDPMSPSKWKEEHFVIVSLSGWGLLIFGGYKLFSGGKDKKEEGHSFLFRHVFRRAFYDMVA
uniref:Uncharacterized protein n=1 Tax=Cannabis sativa TaxID=3483 RepID=A0A803QK73_CANSA